MLLQERKRQICVVNKKYSSVDRTESITEVIQRNPAQRTPEYDGQFITLIFKKKKKRTPVNGDDGHLSVSRVTNFHISSTPLYRWFFSAHCAH